MKFKKWMIIPLAYAVLETIAILKKGDSVYDNAPEEKNPLQGQMVKFIEDETEPENADGVKGHLIPVGKSNPDKSIYDKYVKRGIDKALSFAGLIVLAPVYAGISLAIVMDDPGPILFTQKRVGKDKEFFKLHKFRSMKMSTPHDVPTHMLENPEQYITKVGKVLRKLSLDELPQIWDIFIGNMAVIGPRPALWNQDLLTAERDKYQVNNIRPGLTGWAQINGRDELSISDKAKLDGIYRSNESLTFDIKCFVGSMSVFFGDDSIVEGAGSLKKLLITGANSYIGDSVKEYLESFPDYYEVSVKDTLGWEPAVDDFSGIDAVLNVAGIAHIKENKNNLDMYYKVNKDLAIEIAKVAKMAGVKQYILLSSMSVYGLTTGYISKDTQPKPSTAYGKSKLEADIEIEKMSDDNFIFTCLRPPMVYGFGCRGNYQRLRKIATSMPVFPKIDNQRSMVYIGNLCEFIKRSIDNNYSGIFFPQNNEYVSTSRMVSLIAKENSKDIHFTKLFDKLIPLLNIQIVNKVFGNLTYEKSDLIDRYSFEESIILSENKRKR